MSANRPAVKSPKGRLHSTFRQFLFSEASGGLLLIAVALLAIVAANSPLSARYFAVLHAQLGPLSIQHWISDGLMTLFFLLVGLEVKREVLHGQLSSRTRRLLPGAAAIGGMVMPALIYVAFNHAGGSALRGWAIPSATDIAFALGVLSLLGSRVPASLKMFLAALAIIDDIGAVIIIAAFYATAPSLLDLAGAAAVVAVLVVLNRRGVRALAVYLALGAVLWVLMLRSGIHATIAGVILALTIPINPRGPAPESADEASPLHRLERFLHVPVAFLIVPIFAFANAGVSFAGVTPSVFIEPMTFGVAAALLLGKLIGVFGTVFALVLFGLADRPAAASWGQILGVSLLCGIGFTMSLFIGPLAFSDPSLQDRIKLGVLSGSFIAGVSGYIVLWVTSRAPGRAPASRGVA